MDFSLSDRIFPVWNVYEVSGSEEDSGDTFAGSFSEAAGRHSLLLYLLHQPLLMLVFTAADVLKIL